MCRGRLFLHYMFTRTHTVSGGYAYTEVLESYRDPVTHKPTHRCIARWPAEWSLAEAIAEAEEFAASCQRNAPPRRGLGKQERQRRARAIDRAEVRLAALRLVQEAIAAPAPPP
jgi:hypothetical protein